MEYLKKFSYNINTPSFKEYNTRNDFPLSSEDVSMWCMLVLNGELLLLTDGRTLINYRLFSNSSVWTDDFDSNKLLILRFGGLCVYRKENVFAHSTSATFITTLRRCPNARIKYSFSFIVCSALHFNRLKSTRKFVN